MRRKEKILEKAQKYVQRGAYGKALAEYRSLKEMDPGDVSVRLRLGDLLVQLGMKDEAVKEYAAVAKAHARRGFYLKAIAVYKRILKLEGSNTDTHYKLAELYTKQRLIADAMSQYTIILSAFEQKGMDNEALDLLRKMVDLDPSNQSIRLRLADMYRKLGYTEDALSLYADICSKLIEAGNTKKAEEICLELRRAYPDEPGALRVLMNVYRSLGEAEQFTSLGTTLLRSFIRSGELEEASRVSREILEVSPDHEESLSFLESYGPEDMLEFEPGEGAGIDEEEAETVADEVPGAPMPEVEVEPGEEAEATAEGEEEPPSEGAGVEAATEDAGSVAGDAEEEPVAEAGAPEGEGEEDDEEYEDIEIDLEGFDDLVKGEAAAGGPGEEGAAGVEVEHPEETGPSADADSEAEQGPGAGAEDISEDINEQVEEESTHEPDEEEYVEIEIPGLGDGAQTCPPEGASEEDVEKAHAEEASEESPEPGMAAEPLGSLDEVEPGGEDDTSEEDLPEEIEPLEEPAEVETPSSPLEPPDGEAALVSEEEEALAELPQDAQVAEEEEAGRGLPDEGPVSEGEAPAGQDSPSGPEGHEEEGTVAGEDGLADEGPIEQVEEEEATSEEYLAPEPGPEEADIETGLLPVDTDLPEGHGVEETEAQGTSPEEEAEEAGALEDATEPWAKPIESDGEGHEDLPHDEGTGVGEPMEEGPSEGAAPTEGGETVFGKPIPSEAEQREGELPVDEPRPEEPLEVPGEDEEDATSDESGEAQEEPVASDADASYDEAASSSSAEEDSLAGPPVSEESPAEGAYVEQPFFEQPSDEGAADEGDVEIEVEPLPDLAEGEAGAGVARAADAVDEETPGATEEASSEAEALVEEPGKEERGGEPAEEAAASASLDDMEEAEPPDLEDEPLGGESGFEEVQPVDEPGEESPGAEEVLFPEDELSLEEVDRPEEGEEAEETASLLEESPSDEEAQTLEEPTSAEEIPSIEEAPSMEEPFHDAPDLDEAPPDEREPLEAGLDEAAALVEEMPLEGAHEETFAEETPDEDMSHEGEALGEGEPPIEETSPEGPAPEERGPDAGEGDALSGEDAEGLLEKLDAFLEMDVEEVEEQAVGAEEGGPSEESASEEDASYEEPASEETASEESPLPSEEPVHEGVADDDLPGPGMDAPEDDMEEPPSQETANAQDRDEAAASSYEHEGGEYGESPDHDEEGVEGPDEDQTRSEQDDETKVDQAEGPSQFEGEGLADVAEESAEGSVPGAEEESAPAGMTGADGDAVEGHDEDGPVADDDAGPVRGERPVEETLGEAAEPGAHEEDAAVEDYSGGGLEDVEIASEAPEAVEEPAGDDAPEAYERPEFQETEDIDQESEAEEETPVDSLVEIPETIYDQRPDEEPSYQDVTGGPGVEGAEDMEAASTGVTDETVTDETIEEEAFEETSEDETLEPGEEAAAAEGAGEDEASAYADVEHLDEGGVEAWEGLPDEESEESSEDIGVDEGRPEEEAEDEEPLREEPAPEEAWDEKTWDEEPAPQEAWDEEPFATEQAGETVPQPETAEAAEGMGASEIPGPEEETHEEAVATAEEEHVEDPYDHWELGPSHERGEEEGSTPDAEALSDFIYTEPELEEAIQNLARSSTAGDVFETYEELKTGLENQLSTEDAGTHFNLGKEYLEMELYKEAAREFKIALKDPALEVDCYINLAHCALAEANHEEAIIYFLKVLKGFDGPEDERRGFLYDLATAYEASGQETEAESIYRSIYEVDPRFRNVAYKIKRASARERAIPLEDTMLEVELL